jgi:hypothetical protein
MTNAKFMLELCSLLMHIPTYLDVMRCYNHVLHRLWGFFVNSPYFGYNSTEQETPVLCILTFQGPSRTQNDLGFVWREYFYIRCNLGWRNTRVGQRAQKSTGVVGRSTGRTTHARLSYEPLMSSIFALDRLAWPKNAYIKTPKAFPRGGGRETWNHETEVLSVKIGGGNIDGVAPGRSPTSPISPTPPPWWTWSSPPLDYGFLL